VIPRISHLEMAVLRTKGGSTYQLIVAVVLVAAILVFGILFTILPAGFPISVIVSLSTLVGVVSGVCVGKNVVRADRLSAEKRAKDARANREAGTQKQIDAMHRGNLRVSKARK